MKKYIYCVKQTKEEEKVKKFVLPEQHHYTVCYQSKQKLITAHFVGNDGTKCTLWYEISWDCGNFFLFSRMRSFFFFYITLLYLRESVVVVVVGVYREIFFFKSKYHKENGKVLLI